MSREIEILKPGCPLCEKPVERGDAITIIGINDAMSNTDYWEFHTWCMSGTDYTPADLVEALKQYMWFE